MDEQQVSNEQQPSLVDRIDAFLEADRQKLGGMTLGASLRLGLAEARDVFSLGGDIEQPTPYGMYGTLTPGEVAAGRSDGKDSATQVQQMEQEPLVAPPNEQALPSPSEIAADNQTYSPEQQQGHVHGQEQDRGR